MDRRRLALTAGSLALMVGIGAGPALAADRIVTISGFSYSPNTVTVNVGDTVTWTNQDASAHTATSSGNFNTGNIAQNASKSVTFNSAGTFDYICTIHPTMQGTVVVRAAGGGAAPNTDMAPTGAVDDGGPIAPLLAILGLVMLVGTFAVERLLRRRSARG
jgi:plastocyanin